jgi:carboxyl-terminal processing protease
MKFRGSLYFSILVLAIVAGAWWPSSSQTNPDKEALLMNAILSGLNQLHFQPVAVDDQLSEKVFDLYIDRMDGGKLYFTQKDIHALEQFRLSVDDEIRVGSYEFFNLSTSLMDAAIEKTESYYKEILAAPFDFETMEIIELDGEQKDWAADDEELREYWRKYLK